MKSLREFYYLRHGQTDANLQHLLCGGGWDIALNDTGIKQAHEAAEQIRASISNLGAICTSPLKRARQTADHVAKHFECELHIVDELKEWHFGEWDRKPYQELKHIFHSDINPEGGEARADFNERIRRAIEISFTKADPILIVAHGEVWNAVRRVLEIPEFQMPNAVPHKVWQAGDGKWKVTGLK